MKAAILIPFVVYLLIMMGIGAWCSKSSGTVEGFYLGGRSLGGWVTAFSYAYSAMSSWVLIGYVGTVYLMGPSSFYTLIGFNIGFMISYLVFAKRLRNYSAQLESVTYTDFFVRRVRSCGTLIRMISAIAIVVFMAAYVASQLAAAGKTMSVLFSISPTTAVLITAAVVTAYCVFGGFMAVSITDFAQGIVIVAGVIVLAFKVVSLGGGPAAVSHAAAAIDPNLVTASLGGKSGMVLVGSVIGYIGFAFQLLGRPHDTIRFFAIKSIGEIKKSMMVCLVSLTVTYWAAFAIGYTGRVLFPELSDPEQLFATILTTSVHPVFGGILLAVFMGLLMSTVDSQLLSSASTLAEDLYIKYFGKSLSEKQAVRVTRISIVAVALIGCVIAVTNVSSVYVFTNYASSGLAATYGPVLFLSLYWKRLTGPGAVAGMIGGFVTVVLWQNLGMTVYVVGALPGFFVGLLVAAAVSLCTQQPHQAQIERELAIASRNIDFKADQLN